MRSSSATRITLSGGRLPAWHRSAWVEAQRSFAYRSAATGRVRRAGDFPNAAFFASLAGRFSGGGTQVQDRTLLESKTLRPNPAQTRYLSRGLGQAGGKLPLFDEDGQRIDPRVIRRCMAAGWAEPWFDNPIKPDWLVCRLTPAGRAALEPEA